ncbi:HAD-IA family hydrolase [Edaphobacter sp. HDX4]|uniref:HAD-IA family hydrolase n=1 Tax=Edaphobacter sp. HDX4 TaxID=2794064 RepID=UPI002FE6BA8B
MSEVVRVETKGLLFDMDGVLISSIGSVVRCWHIWAKKYNIPNADTYEVPHGVRAIDIIRSLRPDIDPLEGLQVIEDLEIADTSDLRVLPGAKELLESLPSERWAIVTSATRRLMLSRLEAAGLPVPGRIVSADEVEKGKPDPEPYRKGAQLLGCTPDECIVVEDAPSGVGAGKAAGSRVLGVVGTHTLAQLEQADWIVESLEKVRAEVHNGGLALAFAAEKR